MVLVTFSRVQHNTYSSLGSSSETPRVIFGKSSELVGNPSDRRRKPLGNLRNIFGNGREPLGTPSEHLRKMVVFLPENPPNLSEPLRNPGRNILVKFEEEKGNVT